MPQSKALDFDDVREPLREFKLFFAKFSELYDCLENECEVDIYQLNEVRSEIVRITDGLKMVERLLQ